jgi:hypothetical protein
LKLPQLLSQFLYQTRKLDLPGIGSFTLDSDVVIPQESDKIGQVAATGIHFKNANITAPDDALINFLKEHTGKMKSLTASDLDFFLTTGRQLLNIGKPFYIDGIGTLIKTKDGRLDFTPGEYMVARLEDSGPERRVSYDEPQRERESPKNYSARQAFLVIGIIVGLVVIGWGGYYLYKRNNFAEPAAEKQAVVIPDSTLQKDSSAAAGHFPADTTASATVKPPPGATVPVSTPPVATPTPVRPVPAATVPAATAPVPKVSAATVPVPEGASLYRFVILATSNKFHALKRYNQLLGYQLNIKMDQKDSAWFKLYFPIAAPPRDTTQIKDSLADVYAAPHVYIEH